MLTTFICPECAKDIEADASFCGGVVACPHCAKSVQVPGFAIGPGVTIGGFRLDELLGKGGMGEVYRATQLSMEREVAVKILPSAMTSDTEAVERFLKEARMSAKLDHNNIVTVHDAGEDNGYYYYAMSCVRGESLEEILERDGPFAEKRALRIVRGVAEALEFAWSRHQMLHRDIKPANVMLDENGEPKILDLGLAKTTLEDQAITMTGMILGTPYYMSPEQARGEQDLDCRSDIYSLGATLYHLLTGARPFESGSVMAVLARLATEEPPPVSSLRSDVSENCELLVQVMMAKAKESRYDSYGVLVKDLRRVMAGKRPLGPHGNGVGLPKLPQPGGAAVTMAAPRERPAPVPRRQGGKGIWIWLGVGAAALILVGALALSGGGDPEPVTTATTKAPPAVATTPPVRQKPKPKVVKESPAANAQPPKRSPAEAVEDEPWRDRVRAAVAAGDRETAERLLRDNRDKLTPDERREFMREIVAGNNGVRRNGGGWWRNRGQRPAEPTGQEPGSTAATRPIGEPKFGGKNNLGEPKFGDEDDWDAPAGGANKQNGEVVEAVRDALLELDFEEAQKLLAASKATVSDKPAAKRDFEVAEQVAGMPGVLLASFTSQRGEEIVLGMRSGKKMTFIPESVASGEIVGKRVVRQGQTSGRVRVTIDPEELSIVERLGRLPPESDPAGAIMRGMEALAAGRPDAAERLFGVSESRLGEAMLAGLRERMTAAAEAAAERAKAEAERRRAPQKSEIAGAKAVPRPEKPSTSRLAEGSEAALAAQVTYAKEHGLPIEIVDELGIEYRLVPPGSFIREDGVKVRISQPLYVGKYEVTQEQCERVMGRALGHERGPQLPVHELSWGAARQLAAEACRKLDVPIGTVRLPTEAEWEYAARAGTQGKTYFDPKRAKLKDFANYLDASAPDKFGKFPTGLLKDRQESDGAATLERVGKYRPNAYGLYDVYGNVFEWCSDWGGDYKGGGEQVDPEGPAFGLFKVHRGGSFLYREDFCNSSKRHQSPAKKYHGGQVMFGNALGVRLVREVR